MDDKWDQFNFPDIRPQDFDELIHAELNDPKMHYNLIRLNQEHVPVFKAMARLAYETSCHDGKTYDQMLQFGAKLLLLLELAKQKEGQNPRF
jgi:hypothetical protein